ncbi:MAG TPA: DUF3160 domain-containing protein [Kofleriaceae bacterium]
MPVKDAVCEALAHPTPPAPPTEEELREQAYRDTGTGDPEPGVETWRHQPKHIEACTVTQRNTRVYGDAVLAEHAHPVAAAPPAPGTPRPARLDLIQRRFELSAAELAQLDQRSVVVPARLEQPSYAYAYHEIFQSQLPVYISADSIFHAMFASHDSMLAQLETDTLAPTLAGALDRMHCALVAASADYGPDTARDLDVYLTVARDLTSDQRVHSIRGDATVDAEAGRLVDQIEAAQGIAPIALFGRPRLVDFTQYAPRGHYTKGGLDKYFRASMWASRLEFNLVSRSSRSSTPGPEPDPSETPREAIDAVALADLAHRSGADAPLAVVDQAWGLLAGKREDVSIASLQQLQHAAGITRLDAAAFPALKQAIGDRFQRTVRMHPMPEGTKVLPAIATLIGPRAAPDAAALQALVNGAVPDRKALHAADVAYSFGLDHARRYLAADLEAYPQLDAQLAVARRTVAAIPPGDDLYSAWYAAIRALAVLPGGAVPSVLRGDAGLDLRLNTIATAFGQLKHNYVLMDGQTYSDFGCEIPDGYVEPVPAAYDALIAYAERGARLAALLDPKGERHTRAYFDGVIRTLRVLRAIVDDELANRPLTDHERRWLGMVAELSVDDSAEITGYPPVYSGWYFDLFPTAQEDGMRGADFIADYFTAPDQGISYLGAGAPRLAIFVIDTGGPRRAFVGPVARGYERHTPVDRRLDDDTARAQLDTAPLEEPWARSYTAGAHTPPPRLDVTFDHESGDAVVTGEPGLGEVTVKLLDHHRRVIASKRRQLGYGGATVFAFHRPDKGKPTNLHSAVAGLYLEVGDYKDWVLGDSYNEINAHWGQPPDPP